MGSIVNVCIQEPKKNMINTEIILDQQYNSENFDKMSKIIVKNVMHSYFIRLINIYKASKNKIDKNIENNNNNNEEEEEKKNNEDEEKKENENNIENINIEKKVDENNNEDKNKNKKNNSALSKSSGSILEGSLNAKTIINETNNNIGSQPPDKEKEKVKEEKLKNSTPNPGDISTPTGNYDRSKIPGELIFNFNDIPLNDEIEKVENDLGEFIIEQKELLKYMQEYPYTPQSFSIRYPSGEKYSGYFSPNWEKEVFGIQINPNGSKYVGLFKNGQYEGRGRLIFRKGDYFEGEFQHNKANGFGKYVNIKGEIYIGNWVDDKQDGKGELILKNGSRYTGDFKNGMENGKGKIVWPDSSFYEGDFVNNCFDGYGIYMMGNRKSYIGEWKKGQMNGFGIFNYPDGKSYKGYFEKDKKNGFGIYSGKNILRYEGKYKKGKQYGIGRITNEKGQKQIGLYLKGKRLKILNEKDFKEDIKNIDKEIEKINNIINENEFFKKNLEKLKITQGQYFDNTPE